MASQRGRQRCAQSELARFQTIRNLLKWKHDAQCMCMGTKARAGPQAAARLTAVMLQPPDSQPSCIIITVVTVVVVIVLLHPPHHHYHFLSYFFRQNKTQNKEEKIFVCNLQHLGILRLL